MKGAFTSIIVTATWLCLAGVACAAISIEPVRTELSAPPLAVLEGKIVAANTTTNPMKLFVTFEDRTVLADDEDDLSWIDIDQGTNLLAAGESLDIHYTIHVPSTHKGELFGRVGFAYRKETVTDGQGVSVGIRQKISVPLYVTIQGTEDYSAAIVSMTLSHTNPPSVNCFIEHYGNVHLLPTGDCSVIRVKNNREVARFPINQRRFVVFPGTTNLVAGHAPIPLRPGDYTLKVAIPFPDTSNILTKEMNFSIPGASNKPRGVHSP